MYLGESQFALSWNHYGDADGEPVFYFHGMPGSSLEISPARECAIDLGISIIAVDRPGYGESDRQKHLELSSWPDIIAELADFLNIHHFSVVGFSGGGPYALACAHKLGDRVKRGILVGSLAPFESPAMQAHVNAGFKPLYELAKVDMEAVYQQLSQLAPSAEVFMEAMLSAMPAPDRAIFAQAEFNQNYLSNLSHALMLDVWGLVDDLRRVSNPWRFDLVDINCPIEIWHGRDDANVGVAVGEYLAEALPDATAQLLQGHGHFFMFSQWRKILERVRQSSNHADKDE